MRWSHSALLVSAAACGLVTSPGFADLTEAWVRRWNNVQADFPDYGEAIAIDSSGAIYVAGFTFFEVETGHYYVPRFLTIKYEPDGTLVWVRDYTTAETWAAAAWHVEIDSAKNDVIVAGGVNGHEDWGIVKYGSAGQQHWAVIYEADSYYLTEPDDVCVDDDGNIYLTGDIGSFSGPDPVAPVLKYGSTGQLLVSRRYSGPWGLGASGRAVATDADGNIYVAGTTAMPNLASELFLAKYNAAGTFQWDRTFGNQGSTSHDGARDLIIDENGDIIVVGYLGYNTSAGVDVVLRKYADNGDLIWSTTYGAGGGLDEVVYKLEQDPQGNLIAAGYAETSPGQEDIFAIMFDPQGDVDWAATHAGAGNGDDSAFDLAIGLDGAILLAGVIQPFANVNYAFAAQINPEDGGLIDLKEYGGPMDGDSWAAAIALGPQDEVYVTGSSPDFATDFDVATLRYDRATNLVSATLSDMTVAFGQHIAGTLAEMQASDNFYVRTRSRFGFVASEANVVDVRVGAVTGVTSPQSLNLTVEGRVNSSGGTMKLRLRDWTAGGFGQVHQYPIGTTEAVEIVEDVTAANRVRPSDGRIELSMRASMVVTFSALGFDLFTDHVAIGVRE